MHPHTIRKCSQFVCACILHMVLPSSNFPFEHGLRKAGNLQVSLSTVWLQSMWWYIVDWVAECCRHVLQIIIHTKFVVTCLGVVTYYEFLQNSRYNIYQTLRVSQIFTCKQPTANKLWVYHNTNMVLACCYQLTNYLLTKAYNKPFLHSKTGLFPRIQRKMMFCLSVHILAINCANPIDSFGIVQTEVVLPP